MASGTLAQGVLRVRGDVACSVWNAMFAAVPSVMPPAIAFDLWLAIHVG
jgi:hypothetical protein